MKLFGFDISWSTKAGPSTPSEIVSHDRGGWWYSIGPIIREPFTGGWQRNMEARAETLMVYSTVYSCISLIAQDVSKLGLRLVELIDDIWQEVDSAAFSPVLRKPNRYQTRIQFIESWVLSKLIHGNTYVLKEFDERGLVVALYVLDPMRTKVMVAPDGEVFYELAADKIAGINEQVRVPADDIIHDRAVTLYHPLCGVSPLTACALAAIQGLSIQGQSQKFFTNNSQPGGVLSAPGAISNETAKRLKDYWEANYSGASVGKIAVLGDGLKFEAMAVKAVDAQLIEQLKWSSETVCSVFHVPPFMVGIGPVPPIQNVEALLQLYYSQCIQVIIEAIELLLDEGLYLDEVRGKTYGTEFDITDLLRMDTMTKVTAWSNLVKGSIASPNEARKIFNLSKVRGGESPMAQQQNYSLEALSKRDAKEDPFASAKPAAPAEPAADDAAEPDDEEDDDAEEEAKMIAISAMLDRRLREGLSA